MRPFLHCPEIDEEDEIQVEQVMQCFDGEELTLGSRIAYRLPSWVLGGCFVWVGAVDCP